VKKLFSAIVLLLAMNFLAVGGAVGWLFKTGHLDKAKVGDIRKMLFPPAIAAATTQPAVDDATTQPTFKLDELLAQQSGHTAAEQVDFIQRTFDSRMLELDRRQREIGDLERQVDLANQKLAADRAALDKEQKDLADQQQEATKLASDKGFQDSLALYNAMQAKQVKQIFMTLSEQTVQQYLEAMDPETAGKIIKEFKTPDETAFIQKILERMRLAQASATTTDGKP
jgi:hypothetical protein